MLDEPTKTLQIVAFMRHAAALQRLADEKYRGNLSRAAREVFETSQLLVAEVKQ